MLDGPTGSGKTLVAEAVRQELDSTGVYACTTKSLQAQFKASFPYAKVVMGRANYPCSGKEDQFPLIHAGRVWFAYWLMLCAGKTKDWIDTFILNKYGKVIDGRPVYSGQEYDDTVHGKKLDLTPYPGMPIYVGIDFGLSPAIVPGQSRSARRGQSRIAGCGPIVFRGPSPYTRRSMRDAPHAIGAIRQGPHAHRASCRFRAPSWACLGDYPILPCASPLRPRA